MRLAEAQNTRLLGRVFSFYPATALLSLAFIALWALSPGLSGPFLFDDEPNLNDLGALGGVIDWNSFRAYVASGFSGPSGRPLALASFLIDDNTWPSLPEAFKLTNLKLHLLNFVLLTWLALKLARFYGLEERRAVWLAIINGGIWLLHPLLVSTTFYVVQRMAMLSTLFVFAAMLAYLHGRLLWPQRPRAALTWMGSAIVLGGALATLSKENGALLPLLLLVIEYCRPTGMPRLPRLFSAVFLWLPALAVVGYLLGQWNPAPDAWPHRPFNQIERLLTQPRILWDYLGWWFLPRIEGAGLYQDGWVISRSLTDPPQTLPALLGILTLIGAAFALRRHAPWLSLALLFFFTGHLLESTLLGLELYFEHRNYLPAAFLSLPLAHAVVSAPPRLSRAATTGVVALLVMLTYLTHERATLWGDGLRLEAYWAAAAPDSPRAANALARQWYNEARQPDEARRVLDHAIERHPHNGLLLLSRLQLAILTNEADPAFFESIAEKLRHSPYDAQTVLALRRLAEGAASKPDQSQYRQPLRQIIESLAENEHYSNLPLFTRLLPYLQAKLSLAEGDADTAETYYYTAMQRYGHIDAAMQMVAEMGNAGHPAQALRLLAHAQLILDQQPERTLKLSRATYRREIDRIRGILEAEQASKRALSEALGHGVQG